MPTRFPIFVLLSGLFTAGILSAQHINPPSNIAYKHFYMKDGLPDEVITSVVQDDQGFLWLGTSSGIARFDGYNFRIFQNDPHSSNSLANNSVNCIWQGKGPVLWIGHNEGLDLFDVKTERFIFHWYDSALENKGLNTSVKRVTARNDEKLWIFTNRGVYIADPKSLLIKRQKELPIDLDYNDIIETNDGSRLGGN
jgi:ligand-binding sensor domain-containing protein